MTASTFANLVKLVTPTIGPSTLTLGSAVPGFRGVAALVDGATYSYHIQDGAAFEDGWGVYSASTGTLTRNVDDSSRLSDVALYLSGAATVIVGTVLARDMNDKVGKTGDQVMGGALTVGGAAIMSAGSITYGGAAMSGGYNQTAYLQASFPTVTLKSTVGSKSGAISYDAGEGLRLWVGATTGDVTGSAQNYFSFSNTGNITAPGVIKSQSGAISTVLSYEVTRAAVGATSAHDLALYAQGSARAYITSTYIDLLGGQLKFPATQSPSSDPNTLDDYEEGTWTPGLSFGGVASGSTAAAEGSYVKIGKLVHISGRMIMSAKGGATGATSITGLPFTVGSETVNYVAAITMNAVSGITYPPNGGTVPGNSRIDLYMQSPTGNVALTNSNITNGSEFYFSMTYRAAN